MNKDKRQVLMKTFIESLFGYCPLVWMFYSWTLNNHINRIHERALCLVYNDYENTFQTLLSRDKSFTVHDKNIQTLAIELFKVVKGMSPEIMREVKKELKYCTK